MSVQVRRRRETAAFLSTFVGAQGELLVDTTNNRVQVHDGTTPGGFPAARLADLPSSAVPLTVAQGGTGAASANGALSSLGVIGRTAVADAAYTVLATDRIVAFTALTAARTATLPLASAYPPGMALLVVDESGACSSTNAVTVARAGSDTINGAASAALTLAYGFIALVSNGASKWTIIDQSTNTMAQQAASSVAITGGTIDATTIGATTTASAKFTQAGFGSSAGAAGTANKISLYGNNFGNADFGFGISSSSLDTVLPLATQFLSFYFGASLKHRLSGTAGASYLLSLDNTPIGATTAATMRGTTVTATTSLNLPSYTVATLPAPGTAGRAVYCSNARVFNGAGTQEGAGSGTGGLVTDTGTAWRIAGTNITASA